MAFKILDVVDTKTYTVKNKSGQTKAKQQQQFEKVMLKVALVRAEKLKQISNHKRVPCVKTIRAYLEFDFNSDIRQSWASLGERQGDTSPHVLKGGGHNIKCPPPHVFFLTCVCVSPPKVMYLYKFRLEKGLKLCIFSSPITKFS